MLSEDIARHIYIIRLHPTQYVHVDEIKFRINTANAVRMPSNCAHSQIVYKNLHSRKTAPAELKCSSQSSLYTVSDRI